MRVCQAWHTLVFLLGNLRFLVVLGVLVILDVLVILGDLGILGVLVILVILAIFLFLGVLVILVILAIFFFLGVLGNPRYLSYSSYPRHPRCSRMIRITRNNGFWGTLLAFLGILDAPKLVAKAHLSAPSLCVYFCGTSVNVNVYCL